MIHSYRDLIVWQKGIELVIEVYVLTDRFPSNERFGLTSQMRRAAVSIPSNIAEGKLRGHNKECKQFFLVSFGSGGELETQIEIAKRLYKEKELDFSKVDALLLEVMKMLNKLISDLSLTSLT
ncbi:MAG: four helix bundle protein [Patescibacteria group bacterium]